MISAAFAAGIALACCQSAGAVPAAPTAIKDPIAVNVPLVQVQFREHRTRHRLVKCYRTLVVGPYRCHRFHRVWW